MRAYRRLLHLYPASFRLEYGDEMAAIFADSRRVPKPAGTMTLPCTHKGTRDGDAGFKILRNAGFVPPEVELFHERAALNAARAGCESEAERSAVRHKLSDLEQKIALRLEALRINGTL